MVQVSGRGCACLYRKPVFDFHKIPWMNEERYAYPLALHCPFHPDRIIEGDDDLDKLVPTDLQNVQNPGELSGQQLRIIAQAIAQISIQGLVGVAWKGLYKYASIDDETYARFREIFFESFTNHVLCIYDMEDFQRCADRNNIIKSCDLFLDYLISIYGEEPTSALKALVDISKEKLLLDKFPFLWEQDVAFTLEYYHFICNCCHFPLQVSSFPASRSPVFQEYEVFEHHVESVMKVLKEHVPLKDNEKRDLLIDMEFEAGGMASALSLECLKEIRYEDFEKLNSKEEDLYSPDVFLGSPFLQAIENFSKKKGDLVRMSTKNLIFPLKSGLYGKFSTEVVEVIRLANVERRIVGQRFLSGNLICSIVLRSRIGDRARLFLAEWEQENRFKKEHIVEENRPVYYIYNMACHIANFPAGGQSLVVKVEHLFLATVVAPWRRRKWENIFLMDAPVRFLEACKGETPAPSSPDKKKMKYSEGYGEIEVKPTVSLNEEIEQGLLWCKYCQEEEEEEETETRQEICFKCGYSPYSNEKEWECEEECEEPVERTQMEEFMLCTPFLWTPEFMKHINNAFKHDSFDVRKMIFGVQEGAGERGCKRKKKFSWENIISNVV